jgi:hypothetical protein
MHRFVWNLAWSNPGEKDANVPDGDEGRPPRGPRAVPGIYQVRLTIDGKTVTQPLTIVMDPRSPATPASLEQQLQLGQQIFAEVISSRRTLAEVKSVQKQLSELQPKIGGDHADLRAAASQLETEIRRILASNDDSSTLGLERATAGLAAALAVVESGDRAVPSQAVVLYQESSQAWKLHLADWNHVKTNWLPQINQHLRQSNIAPIAVSELTEDVDTG